MPFGIVTDEAQLAIVDKLYKGYGEQPQQSEILSKGDAYLNANFPLLSRIRSVRTYDVVEGIPYYFELILIGSIALVVFVLILIFCFSSAIKQLISKIRGKKGVTETNDMYVNMPIIEE